jgi:hypothetical protein
LLLVEYLILGSNIAYETSIIISAISDINVKNNVENITTLISPVGKALTIICDVPGTCQYCSIIIDPDNRPINDPKTKLNKGIEIFLKTYLKKICEELNPFVLAIKTKFDVNTVIT